MKNSNQILVGGSALVSLGSSRSTNDTDYLIFDESDNRLFIHDTEGIDLINAANHPFFSQIFALEAGNDTASPQSLLELKAFSFVQHCQNHNWQKADNDEFDMRFLVRTFGLKGVSIVSNHIGAGELSEVVKVINSTRV